VFKGICVKLPPLPSDTSKSTWFSEVITKGKPRAAASSGKPRSAVYARSMKHAARNAAWPKGWKRGGRKTEASRQERRECDTRN